MDESHLERIARIDENVKMLVGALPAIQDLKIESALNKREHKIALSIMIALFTPVFYWICKKIGLPPF